MEIDKYETLEKIGHGAFGVIRKVRRKQDGHILCRKEISYVEMSLKERAQLQAEFSILSSLRHPNIVAYYHREHLKETQDLHIYMEYCGNGDLGRVIKNLKATNQLAQEDFVWSIFSQLVTALYRCHYGQDPPEVGENILNPANNAKAKALRNKGQVMILHRDLKPENIFLGENNSVKLGDFGLSKLMQSQDFASTYVGTPFYMSPEICAADRYTLQSDIWSLGCVMYELCARQPPFNAKTHGQLIERIAEGRTSPLPSVYSMELKSVIKNCLRTDPSLRPDTATLLDLPIVKLMRKEREVVDLAQVLKVKELAAENKLRETEAMIHEVESRNQQYRAELEESLRLEWEAKARLEIDRVVQLELESLKSKFQQEVRDQVEAGIKARLELEVEAAVQARMDDMALAANTDSAVLPTDTPSLSFSDGSEPNELSVLSEPANFSLDSPFVTKAKAMKGTRTPFGRSQTMFVGSPMDIQMAEPSPMSIASLSLSPRRAQLLASRGGRNIFATTQDKWIPTLTSPSSSDGDDDDDMPPLPSPTRQRAKNPFTRPSLGTQKTMPGRPPQLPSIFAPTLKSKTSLPLLTPLKEGTTSPGRLPTKIPAVLHDTTSPTRRPMRMGTVAGDGGEELVRAVTKNNMLKGRTLVELAQARAGGRVGEEGKEKAKMWDPEMEEMPSPFIIRGRKARFV
ncbi:MAG: G2-specific serine/threonine protein kinase [Trizodia sp. TS-e1964]|nr:MAG: G2-specific serine/threonine protein kinase [Trizodia sp. TS-e1964]